MYRMTRLFGRRSALGCVATACQDEHNAADNDPAHEAEDGVARARSMGSVHGVDGAGDGCGSAGDGDEFAAMGTKRAAHEAP